MDTKQQLIEKYRDINVDYEWWDFTYEDFREVCKLLGVDLDKNEPSFSGFWCQGDGASFTGTCDTEKWDDAPAKIREHAPTDETLHKLADDLCAMRRLYFDAYIHIGRQGHRYVHEHSMHVISLAPKYGGVDDWAEVIVEAYEAAAQEKLRELAHWLYDQLENEYEHLTTDEVVWESIVANELNKEMEDV